MRLNYRIYPIDYVQELQEMGKRFKARCFMEYWHDVQMDEINSVGFYTKSWGRDKPLSKGTVHKWIKEFGNEIDRFNSAHFLKGREHTKATLRDSYAENRSERKVNASETFDTSKQPKERELSEAERTASERRVNQDNNIYDYDTRMRAREIDDLYSIYRINTKNAGKKLEALGVYNGLELPGGIGYKDIQRSVILYLNDPEIQVDEDGRKIVYSLANFLRNEIYLNYIPHRLRIVVDGKVIVGDFDRETETLHAEDGTDYRLSTSRMAELLSAGDLEFVFGAAA